MLPKNRLRGARFANSRMGASSVSRETILTDWAPFPYIGGAPSYKQLFLRILA
jgi:hypothetical protein